MLRRLVLLLIVANLAFYAWTQGWLDAVIGVRPTGDREPERLARQVRPEAITILSPAAVRAAATAASAAATAAPSGPACLEAGPFAAAALTAATAALQQVQPPLPPGSWSEVRIDRPGSYIVYMGRFANREALAKKEEELRRTRTTWEELRGVPELEPGFSFGRFEQRGDADKALEQLAQRGIRTARVVELAPASTQTLLRVEKADKPLAARLAALRADALGRGFVPCGS